MPKHLDLMKIREEHILELLELIREKSNGFSEPPIVVIGGYALRAYVPFARYSRDCDFALPRRKEWGINAVQRWMPNLTVEAKEKKDSHGYLRLIHHLSHGKKRIKVSLDFMEGEIRGRGEGAVIVDETFVEKSIESEIQVAGKPIILRVPAYPDYFILKIFACRPSDIRDLAALVWKKGLPEPKKLKARIDQIVTNPQSMLDKADLIIRDLSDERFVDSWRGTFITEEFADADRKRVLKEFRKLKEMFET